MNLFKNKRREKEAVIIFGKPASGRVLIRPISENEAQKKSENKVFGIWNTDTNPECELKKSSDEMLVTVKRGNFKRIVKAIYFPYHHCTQEDIEWKINNNTLDNLEYCKDADSWWVPEGWYEVSDYSKDYTYIMITDDVIAWMSLPIPY